ncbi:MAG: TetR/AcrR family transcriptional regulator [Spirochaetales bacterium]|nr:TetR/AcrR family transcriptional regulator [Spirochaetales bacterium]
MAVRSEKIDPRIRRTRRLLSEALVELCAEKKYSSITVADITRKAGINRATFYLHFEDKDDLLARGFEGFLEELGEGFLEQPARMDDEEWLRFRIAALFRMLIQRRSFFHVILSGAGASPLFGKASAFLEGFLMEYRFPLLKAGEESRPVPIPLVAKAVVSTLIGFASWWLQEDKGSAMPGGKAPTAEEMADYYIRFLRGGIAAAGYGWKGG